jgi:hypothetical protein
LNATPGVDHPGGPVLYPLGPLQQHRAHGRTAAFGDPAPLALIVVADFPVSQQRLEGHIMKGTTTSLHFNGNCRTVMAFYRDCFGGELEVVVA